MSNIDQLVTAEFVNGKGFEAVGEVTETDEAIYVYDDDGCRTRLVLRNILWVSTVPHSQSL